MKQHASIYFFNHPYLNYWSLLPIHFALPFKLGVVNDPKIIALAIQTTSELNRVSKITNKSSSCHHVTSIFT